ncbi:MAG: YicC/YloC family endoribonuclease [Candidatus Omnitrophota bacterium]|jgi:uncharacterized protein (TIGR00255 family)
MIRSMTAFARTTGTAKEGRWTVEIRSINHRYFDFSVKLPMALSVLEGRVKDLVNTGIKRGKVTVTVGCDDGESQVRAISLNEELAETYVAIGRKLQKKYGIRNEFTAGDFLRLPGMLSAETEGRDPEKDWKGLEKVVKRALAQALAAKEEEGRKLAKDMIERIGALREAVRKVEESAKGRTDVLFNKLSERIDQLLAEKEKDQDRMNREVAFLAERSDVTEEVVRLKSHLELFEKRLRQDSEAGRELDFLCQELHREVNTIGSKAQLFEISTEVVMMKGEIEKIREQVQNIE